MTEQDLKELLELKKKAYHKLTEAYQLTRDLAEALDRQDQISIDMVLSMRQRTILELQEIDSYVDLKRYDLNQDGIARMNALLSGAAADLPMEVPLADCLASNNRLLQQLKALDQIVNQKLCGDRSIYCIR